MRTHRIIMFLSPKLQEHLHLSRKKHTQEPVGTQSTLDCDE